MNNLTNASFSQQKTISEEYLDLFKQAQSGDKSARDRIILDYYPLAKSIADKYIDNGVPLDDLIQEGFTGIIHALNKYNCESGVAFGSYARFYVEKYIKQALITQSDDSPIIYKEDFFIDMQRYLQVLDDLTKKLMREPSDKELAEALHMTETKIRRIAQSLFSYFSESTQIQNNELNISPESSVMEHVLDLSCLNIKLNQRENEVVSRRLGFTSSGQPQSISDISKEMGLSYEMTRLTYSNVLKRIQKAVVEKGYTISTIKI